MWVRWCARVAWAGSLSLAPHHCGVGERIRRAKAKRGNKTNKQTKEKQQQKPVDKNSLTSEEKNKVQKKLK